MYYRSRFKREHLPVKHKSAFKIHGERKFMEYPPGLGGVQSLMNGPMKIKLKSHMVPIPGLR